MNEKNKVVYFVGHYGGFLLCLLHKASFYKDSEALYIYVKTYSSQPTNDFMQKISTEKIDAFGQVICMDESLFWGLKDEVETKNKVIEHYNAIFDSHNIVLDENTDIYMNFDEFNSMGIYLNSKMPKGTVGIITTALERLVSYVDMYLFNEIEDRHFYSKLQRECRTLDKDGKYVTKIIRTFDIDNIDRTVVRKEAIENAETYEYFNLDIAKKNLSFQQANVLKNLFQCEIEKHGYDTFNMLLLSSNFTAFKLSTTEKEFIYGNQILADYCLGNKPVVIKPHPRADYGKDTWEKAFNNCCYIPGYLPAEYMEDIGINIGTLLATGSTGTSFASRTAKRKISFGRLYWFNYQYIHQIYSLLHLAAYLGIKDFYYFGIPDEMVDAIIECYPMLQVFQNVNKVNRIGDITEESVIVIPVTNKLGKDLNTWMQEDLKNIIGTQKNVIISFLGMENDFSNGIWNDVAIKSQLIDFVIKKEKIKKEVLAGDEDELFSIYCPNLEKRKKVKTFSLAYSLQNAGISLNIFSKAICVDIDSKGDFLLDAFEGMSTSLSHMTRSLNTLVNFMDERLQLISSFKKYIHELQNIDKAIIISVRDTPGHKITPELSRMLQNLGLNEDLHAKHWHSYAAVIYKKHVLFEKLSAENAVYYETEILDNNITVSSAALKHGNKARIEINNKEYSINGRGLNIVVYDLLGKNLIDSVCFDSHVNGIPCVRETIKII